MLVYTSITNNYLPKARVLASSLKKFHPDWWFCVLLSDKLPANFNLEDEPFDEILLAEDLPIENWKGWAFGHDLVELCTAVKGPAAKLFASREGVDCIMYLDPDIKVFSSLESLSNKLYAGSDILLTPHLLHVEHDLDGILDNELSVLKHGIFNLGFFAAKTSGDGIKFINWWSDRLEHFCLNDIPNGLFTDQKWCDEAPAFFEKLHIVRDVGCNVATWNIAHRPLTKNNLGDYYAGDVMLKFYHFTGYDSGAGFSMLNKYGRTMKAAQEMWEQYKADLIAGGQNDSIKNEWYFSKFQNGEPIPIRARRMYRERSDLQLSFPDPYCINEPSYFSWWLSQASSATPALGEQGASPLKRVLRKLKRSFIG